VTAPRPHPGVDPGIGRGRHLSFSPVLVPAAIVLVGAISLAFFHGGNPKTVWYSAGLFALVLLSLVLVAAPPTHAERSRAFDRAAAAFALFTAWNFLSILWADIPGDAWEGANRTLLYFVAFVLVGLRPWPWPAARVAVGLVVAGVTIAAAAILGVTAFRSDPASVFLGGRLSDPFGYANATSNFWMIAFWPALHFGIDRATTWWVRGPALGAAALLVQVAILSQSRGALASFAITAVVFVLLHPRHWAAIAAVAGQLALVVIGWDVLTEVRNAANGNQLGGAMYDARVTIAIAVAIATVIGLAVAWAEAQWWRRSPASASRARFSRNAFRTLVAVSVLGVGVTAALSTDWLDARWDEFSSTDYATFEAGKANRFISGLESGRYDVWRVSWNEFADHPVTGIGAENFAVQYLEDRRTNEAPRYPHSLAFSLLAMLGIVGVALFVAWIALGLQGFAAIRLRGSPPAQATAAGALAGFVAWLSHSMFDWLWEFPALTILALGLFAIACRTTDETVDASASDGAGSPPPLGSRIAVGAFVVFAAASLAVPAAAARYERSGYEVQGTSLTSALSRLDRSARLDPLSADPLIGRAILLRNAGRTAEARADLREAVEREPNNWFAQLEAGLLDAQARRWKPATAFVRRSRALNPRQPVLQEVVRSIERRERIDPREVEAAFAGQVSARFNQFGGE
jgi:hypothetical protein